MVTVKFGCTVSIRLLFQVTLLLQLTCHSVLVLLTSVQKISVFALFFLVTTRTSSRLDNLRECNTPPVDCYICGGCSVHHICRSTRMYWEDHFIEVVFFRFFTFRLEVYSEQPLPFQPIYRIVHRFSFDLHLKYLQVFSKGLVHLHVRISFS